MADKKFGSSAGLTILAEDQATPANGMVNYITSSYQSGWQNGDIKGAFLSDTNDTDLVGGTDADRSVNGNDLTVNGTVTRTPVATGADLVAYSGFSASNYLEQPYNPDLDFGTGDFCVMGWVNPETSNDCILHRADTGGTGPEIVFELGGTAYPTFFVSDSSNTSFAQLATDYSSRGPTFMAGVKDGALLKLYVDGVLVVSADASAVGSLTNTSAVLRIGLKVDGNKPQAGSLALIRISATAPTAEQIAKIYNDEKVLFQENAQATLYGASDAVTALAHDPDTDLLHVGTSAGRSVFNGLLRVNNTTTGVTTAISAANGVIGEQ